MAPYKEVQGCKEMIASLVLYSSKATLFGVEQRDFGREARPRYAKSLYLKSCSWKLTLQQCKHKIEVLKTRYKQELDAKKGTRKTSSKWQFFDQFDEFLSTNPKAVGIPGAQDTGMCTLSEGSAINYDFDLYLSLCDEYVPETQDPSNFVRMLQVHQSRVQIQLARRVSQGRTGRRRAKVQCRRQPRRLT